MSCDHTPTINRIIAVCGAFYMPISASMAEQIWLIYSDYRMAGWLVPIDLAYEGVESLNGDAEILRAVIAYRPIVEVAMGMDMSEVTS